MFVLIPCGILYYFSSSLSNPTLGYILQASFFSVPKKSFFLHVYAEAMARASPPKQPTRVPRGCHEEDPRVLDFLDINVTVDDSFPVDRSNSVSTSPSLNTCPLCLQAVVMIVVHHLLRCLHLYFLQYWCYFFIGFAMRLPRPLPLIFMMVFLLSRLSFFLGASLLLLFIVTRHFPIPLHGWNSYFCKDIPILVLLSHDVSITFSIFVGVSLDFIYRNS